MRLFAALCLLFTVLAGAREETSLRPAVTRRETRWCPFQLRCCAGTWQACSFCTIMSSTSATKLHLTLMADLMPPWHERWSAQCRGRHSLVTAGAMVARAQCSVPEAAGADALRPKPWDQWRLRAPQPEVVHGEADRHPSQQQAGWVRTANAVTEPTADGRGRRRKASAALPSDAWGSDASRLRCVCAVPQHPTLEQSCCCPVTP